jgi:hypothetical protein
MVMGREKLSPVERLREKASAFKLLAEGLPYGSEREDLLVRASRRQMDIVARAVATHVKSHRGVGPFPAR